MSFSLIQELLDFLEEEINTVEYRLSRGSISTPKMTIDQMIFLDGSIKVLFKIRTKIYELHKIECGE